MNQNTDSTLGQTTPSITQEAVETKVETHMMKKLLLLLLGVFLLLSLGLNVYLLFGSPEFSIINRQGTIDDQSMLIDGEAPKVVSTPDPVRQWVDQQEGELTLNYFSPWVVTAHSSNLRNEPLEYVNQFGETVRDLYDFEKIEISQDNHKLTHLSPPDAFGGSVCYLVGDPEPEDEHRSAWLGSPAQPEFIERITSTTGLEFVIYTTNDSIENNGIERKWRVCSKTAEDDYAVASVSWGLTTPLNFNKTVFDEAIEIILYNQL